MARCKVLKPVDHYLKQAVAKPRDEGAALLAMARRLKARQDAEG